MPPPRILYLDFPAGSDNHLCGVFVGHQFRLLDMLKMTSKQTYVDTGIPDTDVYGVRFGFYGNECAPEGNPAGTFANLIGTKEDEGGFTLGMNNSSFSSWYWVYRGTVDSVCVAVTRGKDSLRTWHLDLPFQKSNS